MESPDVVHQSSRSSSFKFEIGTPVKKDLDNLTPLSKSCVPKDVVKVSEFTHSEPETVEKLIEADVHSHESALNDKADDSPFRKIEIKAQDLKDGKPAEVGFFSKFTNGTSDENQPVWRYINDKGDLEGFYTSSQMDFWYKQFFLHLDLKVCFKSQNQWVTIAQIERNSDIFDDIDQMRSGRISKEFFMVKHKSLTPDTSAEKQQAYQNPRPHMAPMTQPMMMSMPPQGMQQSFFNQLSPIQQQLQAMNPATQQMTPQQQMLMQQMCSPMMYMNFVKMMMSFVQNGAGMAQQQ